MIKSKSTQHNNFQKASTVINRNTNSAILFDIDGVLIDVSCSYRKTIQETVRFFTGKTVSSEQIQDLKEQGGYNNDWDLTEAIISKIGKKVPKSKIIEKFQQFYIGYNDRTGFVQNEEWLLSSELLLRLYKRYLLGIVTGRPRNEALFALKKFGVEDFFDVVVALEDYPAERSKPDPFSLNLALENLGKETAVYVGDSVDDMKAAKLANMRPIGCLPPGVKMNNLKTVLKKNGAEVVLENINDIASLLL